jgi:dTDP-4-amino-4,6-dideoxygalactose transaminase
MQVAETKTKTARNERFIPYCQHTITNDEISEVVKTLKSNWLTSGPRVVEFERAFADYIGVNHAIAVNSCTAALHLVLSAYGIDEGDEVITTPMTFCATAEVVEYQRAKPIFVDIDPYTFNLDVERIEEKITSRTRAILPVHYGGIPCNMTRINRIAEKHDLFVLEDAAHAVGSEYGGKKIGNLGNPTAFSFYPTKNMTTAEGGVITTNDEELANRLKSLSLHGISKDAWKRYSDKGHWYYEVTQLGYKYNFTDLQAALGLHQLKKLDLFNKKREQLARTYFDELKDLPEIEMPGCYSDYFSALNGRADKTCWHLFVIMLNTNRLSIDRAGFIEEMKKRGIGTSVHFIPLHLHPYYATKYGLKRGDFPTTESIYDRMVSIPLYPKLTSTQLHRVIKSIKGIINENRKP